MSRRRPTYLRAVVTTRCNHRCGYCHGEGEQQSASGERELPGPLLTSCLRVMARSGTAKIKLMGGEAFLRSDLADLVSAVRGVVPAVDISIITAGVVPVSRLDAVLRAGLDRVNVSIHGFRPRELALRGPGPEAHAQRARFVDTLFARGLDPKINYVYTGHGDREDLDALLEWAAARGALVNVLDNLQIDLSYEDVAETVRFLRGDPDQEIVDDDPHSLPTLRWIYADGLRVEIKHTRLGDVAPYAFCRGCRHRDACREGIFAERLTSTGMLVPCMHRPDLGIDLAGIVSDYGEEVALEAVLSKELEA
ncbi:MAG: radical SAM protein [Armatimonadota bacterium]